MDEGKLVKEIEQEVENKKIEYESLLKENPPLNQAYQKNEKAAMMTAFGVLFALVSIFIGLFPLGVVIVVILGIIYYRRNKHFELLFEEMASDELKNIRKEHEELEQRLKETKKEQQSAKLRENLQRERERAKQMEDEDDERTGEEVFIELLTGLYHRELISSHLVSTEDLTDRIYKNAFAAQSFLDKAVALVGDVIKIDYDKRREMPYILIGSGHYISADVCDKYACYFTDPKQIATLEKLQAGDMLTICGVFTKTKYAIPSEYIMMQSYILDIE